MKKYYSELEFEVIAFKTDDVITTSCVGGNGNDTEECESDI